MKKIVYYLSLVALVLNFLLISGCSKDETDNTKEDKDLYQEAIATTGFTYYLNNDTIRHSSPTSPHNDYFRVRFDSTAYAELTEDGKLPATGTFPVGSVIVKELYDTQEGELQLIAVIKKSSSSNASDGWLWAEYNPDGTVAYSVNEKGSMCVSCHTIDDRDHVRIFELFP